MSVYKQFEVELNRLFQVRTHLLLSAIGKVRPGKPPTINKQRLISSIEKLQDLASKYRVEKNRREEFDKQLDKRRWHPKKGKGWGVKEKKHSFDRWFTKIRFPYCIYIFWAGRKCIYVGRTVRGKGRITSHFEKIWFPSITRIDVYYTSKRSEIPKLECFAVHLFGPSKNENRPADKKWTKKCQVCEVRALIRSELKKIFKLK
jgi:hypothetical protein